MKKQTNRNFLKFSKVFLAAAILCWSAFGVPQIGSAQVKEISSAPTAGELDPTFAPAIGGGYGVFAFARQTDGKILVGGNFKVFGGSIRSSLVRLNADGTIDSTFQPNVNNIIYRILALPDGKILIAGNYTQPGGQLRYNIARLNADGSPDTSFNPGTGADGFIYALALQPDGKILVGGFFSNFNTVNRNSIARVNPDGSFDGFFEPGTGFRNGQSAATVFSIVVEADGKILVGGDFTTVNGISRNDLARLNADGSVDTGFAPLPGSDGSVRAVALQADGKVLAAGTFSNFNGAPRLGLTRLNVNGTTDNSFSPASVGTADDVYVQTDGKILVGDASPNGLSRLNADGSLDTSFTVAPNTLAPLPKIIFVEADGTIVTASRNTNARNTFLRIARLNANGSAQSLQDFRASVQGLIYKVLAQPNGKILIGGNFTDAGGVDRRSIARLNQDGSPDDSFDAPSITSGLILDIAVQADGKILVAGSMTVNGTANSLTRLNSDGSLDNGFNRTVVANPSHPAPRIVTVAVQADGKILIGGYFATVNNINQPSIARLNPDGTLDGTFTISSPGPNSVINEIIIQPDGKILAGSSRDPFNQQALPALVRINPNSTIDNTFSAFSASQFVGVVTFALRPNGKIVASYNGTVNQLNSNGSTDTTFAQASFRANSILIRPSGKVLLGGSDMDGTLLRARLLQLNADGTPDASFTAQITEGREVLSLAGQTDGKILIGGDYAKINNIVRTSLARINGEPGAPTGRTAFDFDGDGRADIAVFRPSSGYWYELRSQSSSFYALQFGQSGDSIAPADYDGDGRADIAVFRIVNSGAGSFTYFYVSNSADNSFRAEQFGITGDLPVSGDWDGDGKADLAVYRDGSLGGGQGRFYYRPSSQPGVDFRTIAWGAGGDKPLVGDFDGDGRLDAAVFRPATAQWFILFSSDNSVVSQQFGASSDIPTPADFDGDGRANIAVFRPAAGTWFTSTNPLNNYGAVQFGQAGDLPVPADYDGDGKADVAVFRPSTGAWYLLRSTQGLTGVSFGSSEDKPAPNAFIR